MSCVPPDPRRIRRSLAAVLLAVLLSGCRDGTWQTRDIGGFMPDLAFTLTDEQARTVHADDYAGNVVMLFFGFSHCQMACPATLGKLSAALDGIGAPADRARVLFVSVDPERDTPARLGEYADAFAPQVIGLTGSMEQLHELARRYRVAFSYGDGYPGDEYPVYHSSAVFVFDGDGEVRLLFQQDDSIDAIKADLQHLLQQNPAA